MFPQTWEDPAVSNAELGGVAVSPCCHMLMVLGMRSAHDCCLGSLLASASGMRCSIELASIGLL